MANDHIIPYPFLKKIQNQLYLRVNKYNIEENLPFKLLGLIILWSKHCILARISNKQKIKQI